MGKVIQFPEIFSEKNSRQVIDDIIRGLLNPPPRDVCVCGMFSYGNYNPRYMDVTCKNCGGNMSKERWETEHG